MAAREKISIDVKIAKTEENVIKTKEKYAEAVKKLEEFIIKWLRNQNRNNLQRNDIGADSHPL